MRNKYTHYLIYFGGKGKSFENLRQKVDCASFAWLDSRAVCLPNVIVLVTHNMRREYVLHIVYMRVMAKYMFNEPMDCG